MLSISEILLLSKNTALLPLVSSGFKTHNFDKKGQFSSSEVIGRSASCDRRSARHYSTRFMILESTLSRL